MAESEERVNLFLEDIDHDALEKRDAIESEVNKYIEAQLASVEEEARSQAEAAISEQRNRLRVEANRQFAAVHNRVKLALSQRRIEIQQSVFSQAREKLAAFAASADYEDFLKKSVSALAAQISGEAVILVREQDLPFGAQLQTAFGRECAVEVDRSIKLGGCKVKDLTNGLIADDTLEVRLNAQEEWFLANARLPISITEEVG